MPAPKEILDLVDKFSRNREEYMSPSFNEATLRQEFLNPFFKVLGWDVDNMQGHAMAYREVIHEDQVKVGDATKAPDYAFRVGGQRKFFVEAKKPAINIEKDPGPAYQLRRYAWSAGLPVSILTDFEEFAVYDTRIKPDPRDKAGLARVMLLRYTDYAEKWDEIAAIFAKESVYQGAFDKYADAHKKRGQLTVDADFLNQIEDWREHLAKNLKLRNPKLSIDDLNFAVGKIIDRIIFLRVCEGRGIETTHSLQALLNGENAYTRLLEIFRWADDKYNSGLFHFKKEKGRPESPDELTTAVEVDDKVIQSIVKGLYLDSPYEFSVLPVEILGQIYEQFLGKVIVATDQRAHVEEKPEVRKAGGVYYTPRYIVDYIVANTVGKLLGDDSDVGATHASPTPESAPPDKRATHASPLRKMTPKEASNLKILDPACGSGSFLLGAYQYLLNWHRKWYAEHDPEKLASGKSPVVFKGPGGDWRLTAGEKKRILLNNIHGVDIDRQAVEVTKLSLLLQVLEGETAETLGNQKKLFQERALPDLGGNIKCGNSLIGWDFFEGQLTVNDELRKKINPFDWKAEFSEIMKQGGFDAIIGNPPYIPPEIMLEDEKVFFTNKHQCLYRKYDSSIVFILEGIGLLNLNGLLGFISSVTWQTGENYKLFRELLFTKYGIASLINLPFDVFKSAFVDTGVYVISKRPSKSYNFYGYKKKDKIYDLSEVKYQKIGSNKVIPPDWKLVINLDATSIANKLNDGSKYVLFGDLTESTQGLAGNKYSSSPSKKNSDWYPYLVKGQVQRYHFIIENKEYTDISKHNALRKYYEAVPKLLIRRVISRADRLLATYSKSQMVFKKDINPFVVITKEYHPYYLLGIINSKLISYLYINTSSIATKDDFRQTTLSELRKLPIPSRQDTRIIAKVEQMLGMCDQVSSAKPGEQERLQRQIDATDRQIDALVYELYGLTDEEIKIVEGAAS